MRFRVLTYNVHQCVGTDGRRDPERVVEVIRHHNADVVCLQEVAWHAHDSLDAAQPRRIAKAVGLPHAQVGFYRNLKTGAWGNVTLSRFPIHEAELLDLSLLVRGGRTRGALYTEMHVHGRTVHLFNLHFGLAGFERWIQMGTVLQRCDEIAPHGAPVVLAGDTNDWRNRLVCGAVASSGFNAATCRIDDPGHATYPSKDPVAALDKVFVRGHVRVVRTSVSRLALAKLASDHLPVVVELELRAS